VRVQITVAASFSACKLERALQEKGMLTIDQKAAILRKAGITVPAFPDRSPRSQGSADDAEAALAAAVHRWSEAIDVLYVQYAAARAARSLRDAEQAHQLDALRRAADRSSA